MLQAIVTTCAVVGAVLGVINFIRSYLSDAERGSVVIVEGDSDRMPAIEVVNHSQFPISVTTLTIVEADGERKVILNSHVPGIHCLPE